MKRVGADEEAVIFQLSGRERDFLIKILQDYPVVPPAHQALSKELKDPRVKDYQRLLDEALAQQRAAHKSHLHAWLETPERFKKTRGGYRFSLERAESEWLLQVLNDIRVGNWLGLGSPEALALNPENIESRLLPTWLAMQMSGHFQMTILEALES